ncbi:hypothetical protein MOQ_009496 [Trypanosoma cruzi marinkellei]|uniref:Uncharacterized protein n=1 Tax=Trypanosoma cruzi marinkellei TaxID=85056 RepID=K2LVP6_TRYCR|nr:hypothetical protein MOQ_009496 [Trypanosoma cruzi marinkellei]
MYHGSEEELRAAEMAGRVYDNLCTSTPPELHGIRQLHTSHIGGASLDGENESTYGSHNTSTVQQSQKRRMGGTYPQHAGVNAVVEIARRESVLRQLYNDKLRGSVSAIFSALMNELPRDSIFLQLLSDPSTEQYCRVRVGEVVESFLFSVQAHQYHNLASELAKREVEVLTVSGQLEEAQKAQWNASPPLTSCKTTQTDDRIDAGMNTEHHSRLTRGEEVRGKVEEEQEEAAAAARAAQDELIALLEDVTREHELAKCRECLSAPMSLLETVHAEGNYHNKYEYLSDVVGHLFRSVQGLVLYAEGSLNSLESLRHGLRGVWGPHDNESDTGGQKTVDPPLLNSTLATGPFPSSLPSSTVSAAAKSPMRQQQEQQRLAIFEEERTRLEMLAAQLKYAQRHCCEVVEGLGKGKEELQRQCTAHQQQLEHLQQVSVRNNTQELSRALKANENALVQLREDLQQSFATEIAQARERERELEQRCVHQSSEVRQVTEMLALAREQLQMEVERRNQAEQRVQEAEEAAAEAQRHCGVTVSDLHRDVEAEKDAMEAKLQHLQRELIARHAEAVCVRQESMVLDANVKKMECLLEHGYERAAAEQHYTLLLTKEAARHAQIQIATEQRALREREATAQQCYEDLCSLLECMREDEYKAEAQQREEEADTEARRRLVSVETHSGSSPKKKKNDECGTVEEVDDGNDDEAGGKTKVLLYRYGTPTTLTGVVTCLQNAYEAVRRHQRYMQSTVDAYKERVRQLQQEVATLRPRLEQLMVECEEQQVNFKRIWNEQTMWQRQETLKGLLAKQEALLSTVNVEREALQVRWSTLSEEYRALERRNSQLHERCAVKEAENARLLGFLRAKEIKSPSSSSPSSSAPQQQQPTSTSSRSPGVVRESPAEAKTNEKETVVENSPDTRRTETSTVPRHPVSRGSSSVAGLSGQARTSCSSFLDEEAAVSNSAVGAVLPLGQHPHERGVWRTACRLGRSVRTNATATTTAAEGEPCERK